MVARLPVAVYVKLTGVSPGLERERSRYSWIGDDSSATFYASAEIGKSSIVGRRGRELPIDPARQSFSVGGEAFSYDVLDDTLCLHDAPYHAGPLRQGLNVGIHYWDGCIQRIDVMENGTSHISKP